MMASLLQLLRKFTLQALVFWGFGARAAVRVEGILRVGD